MKTQLLTAVALAGCLCMSIRADLSQFGASLGYMVPFENDGGSKGAYAGWESAWAVADLKTVTSDDLTFELFPNFNTYNEADPYWSDGAGDGNKWLEATTYREYVLQAGETEASLDFTVGAFDLDSRYNLTVFIKTLDPGNNFSIVQIDDAVITGTMGSTTLSIDTLTAGHILQVGFQMAGINANPETDWGSATATLEGVSVIPEPATFGLLGVFGAGLIFARRHLKR